MIREERLRQRQTQEALADRARVHATEISHLECGRRNPSYLFLRKICIGLGMPLSELINRAEELERAERA